MSQSKIWPLPTVRFAQLGEVEEKRPVALLTSDAAWEQVSSALSLPLVVQAEPTDDDRELMTYLSDNLPSQVQAVYVVGTGVPVSAGKLVAQANNIPLVLVPTALDSDAIFEAHVAFMSGGLIDRIEGVPAHEVIIDWEIIKAAPQHERAAAIVDVLAIVTALLDWRYGEKKGRNSADQRFSAWAAGIAAGLASQAIKSAKAIGEGQVEALRTLVNLLMISVQLAHQLGHDRHQEGTEHYFAFSLRNQGVKSISHAEAVAPGMLIASALHGQDPGALRDALNNAGIRLDQVRAADVRLAINDLPSLCTTNNLPYSIAHDLDPFSEEVTQALDRAGYQTDAGDTGGWEPVSPPPSGDATGDTSEGAATAPQSAQESSSQSQATTPNQPSGQANSLPPNVASSEGSQAGTINPDQNQ